MRTGVETPRGQELINRYRQNYAIRPEAPLTEAMILEHWRLERELTKELLASTPKDRWETFERCYSTLYTRLEWLNRLIETAKPSEGASPRQAKWAALIGPPPKRIYEVGSGKAKFISYLASLGHVCRATEITRERGEKHVVSRENLTWGISDGVHFDRFEERSAYDVVLSDNVVEHLHPDDLAEHFRGVAAILTDGGRYIVATPHVWYGPSDVSWVFRCETAMGMHLKEYTNHELASAARQAGFKRVGAVYGPSGRSADVRTDAPRVSVAFLRYLYIIESVLSAARGVRLRERFRRLARILRLPKEVFLVAEK